MHRHQPTHELELKLDLTEAELQRLRSRAVLRKHTVGKPVTRVLRSIYFDTAAYSLQADGIALRVRRKGKIWVQTVKADREMRSGVIHVRECETEVKGPKPELSAINDPDLQRRVRAKIGEDKLTPVFETVIRRTSRIMRDAKGGEVELAFDSGVVSCENGKLDIREAELELTKGDASSLLGFARVAFGNTRIRLGESSKAERGYQLAKGQAAPELKPLELAKPKLHEDQNVGEAFIEIAGAAIDQILHNWRIVLESDEPEGPHQMRVGLRRLRSAIGAFRPGVDSETLREFNNEARDLARLVGELRDADVLVEDVCDPVPTASDNNAGQKALMDLLAEHRVATRERIRNNLAAPRRAGLQLELALFTKAILPQLLETEHPKALDKPIGDQAQKALDRAWRKVVKWGRAIDQLSIDQRHEMRKALKTLRYGIEFFMPLYAGKDANKFLKDMKRLQDVFGYLNDVAMAEHLIVLCKAAGDDRDAPRYLAARHILDWHKAQADHAWIDAQNRWFRLEDSGPFWR